jgi:hypothetical protein
VQEAIEKNLTNRTVIIIAHRLSTVERADRIIVIDHGAIAEQGPHKQLLHSGGLYSQLVKRQLLAAGEGCDEVTVRCSSSPDLVLPISLDSSHDSSGLAFSHHSEDLSASPAGGAHGLTHDLSPVTNRETRNDELASRNKLRSQTQTSDDKERIVRDKGECSAAGVVLTQGSPRAMSTSPPIVQGTPDYTTSTSPLLVLPLDTDNSHLVPRVMLAQNGQSYGSDGRTVDETDEKSSHDTVT